MDGLHLWSWSHDTTTRDALEPLLVNHRDLEPLLRDGATLGLFDEAVVLSTCNRLELYSVGLERPRQTLEWLTRTTLPPQPARMLTGPPAVRHLFRVAAGLESRRLGEEEIHAQVRSAVAVARRVGTARQQLGPLLDRAIGLSRTVRKAGRLDEHVPRMGALVDVALRREGTPPPANVAVVGSGQLARSVLADLHATGYATTVSTRRPREVAQRVFPMTMLDHTLERAEAAVFATAVSRTLMDRHRAEDIMKRRSGRPLVLVDLGVPNNVASDVGAVTGIALLGLAAVEAAAGILPSAARRRAAELVDQGVDRFLDDAMLARRSHLIVDLRARVHDLIRDQLIASAARSPDGPDLYAVARSVSNQLLHRPTQLLKAALAAEDEDTVDLILGCFTPTAAEPSSVPSSSPLRAAG